MKILAISGSLQSQSGNLSLLRTAQSSAPPGVEIVLYEGLASLPHFNPDLEKEGPPPEVLALREAIASSSAILIASPEYGHSLPGALKNAIDWLIGSGELEGKTVAITAATPHPDRGRKGLEALRITLGAVRATLVGGTPIPRGPSFDQEVQALVTALVEKAREQP